MQRPFVLIYFMWSQVFSMPPPTGNNGNDSIYNQIRDVESKCSFPPGDLSLLESSCDRNLPRREHDGSYSLYTKQYDYMGFLCYGVFGISSNICQTFENAGETVTSVLPKTSADLHKFTLDVIGHDGALTPGDRFCKKANESKWFTYKDQGNTGTVALLEIVRGYLQDPELCKAKCAEGEINPLCEIIFWGNQFLQHRSLESQQPQLSSLGQDIPFSSNDERAGSFFFFL